MPFSRAGQLARSVPTARLTDKLGLVAENLRSSPYGVVPVLDRITFGEGDPSELKARVLGLIDVRDLDRVSRMVLEPAQPNFGPMNFRENVMAPPMVTPAATDSLNGLTSESEPPVAVAESAPQPATAELPPAAEVPRIEPHTFENITAREIMNADVPHIPALFSLHNALVTLDRYQYAALPVIDDKGQYKGLISRADILAALGKNVRPSMVGGMATPLGVWLTNGNVNGGAPNFGLFLSGLTLAGCLAFSTLALTAILWSLNPAWGASALSGRVGMVLETPSLLNTGAFLGHSLLFLLALRAIPMAGIHAAEHQTVHAMERGLPLELEFVSQMPRAHPRCGTNLMALVGLVTIGFTHLPDYGSNWILMVLVLTYFGWRNLGEFIQVYFTTRPASKKQLESGIKAGRELMENYQAQPFAAPAKKFGILNNGLFISMAGMIVGLQLFLWLLSYLSRTLIQ